ncbi:MAG: hypothetical protein JWN86_977 [Planctomycetota bacterium]|nr:hypothetical protein [Planctomycetota bacterium]
MSEPLPCLTVERSGRIATVTYLTAAYANRFEEWSIGAGRVFDELIEERPGVFVILDLEEKTVPFDHLALNQIARLGRRLPSVGGALWLCGVNPEMTKIMRMLRMEVMAPIAIAIDRADAMRRFGLDLPPNPALDLPR